MTEKLGIRGVMNNIFSTLPITRIRNKERINGAEFWYVVMERFKHRKRLLCLLLRHIDDNWSGVRFKLRRGTKTPAFSKFRNGVWDLVMLNKGTAQDVRDFFDVIDGKDIYISNLPNSLLLKVDNYMLREDNNEQDDINRVS